MTIVNGKQIAERILNKIKKEVKRFKKPPVLAVILVGDDPSSHLYVKIKEKRAQEIGIDFKKYLLPENTKETKVIDLISQLNIDKKIDAIVLQLPLPKHLNTDKIIKTINPQKDVDGLTKKSKVMPPTVGAIMEIFSSYNININNKKIVIVGHGRLVGKPLSAYFKKLKINHTVCDKNTSNLAKIAKTADILISATGFKHLIKADMIKKDAVIIDANNDIDFENVKNKASYITPPTGGLGPVTVAKLLENVILLSG